MRAFRLIGMTLLMVMLAVNFRSVTMMKKNRQSLTKPTL